MPELVFELESLNAKLQQMAVFAHKGRGSEWKQDSRNNKAQLEMKLEAAIRETQRDEANFHDLESREPLTSERMAVTNGQIMQMVPRNLGNETNNIVSS
ncbi:hypothetical protein J6590_052496 [Homalodisca vitripennis]|nr:hypothetical protein J6590_052496 [Homalodisca vitripennis]